MITAQMLPSAAFAAMPLAVLKGKSASMSSPSNMPALGRRAQAGLLGGQAARGGTAVQLEGGPDYQRTPATTAAAAAATAGAAAAAAGAAAAVQQRSSNSEQKRHSPSQMLVPL